MGIEFWLPLGIGTLLGSGAVIAAITTGLFHFRTKLLSFSEDLIKQKIDAHKELYKIIRDIKRIERFHTKECKQCLYFYYTPVYASAEKARETYDKLKELLHVHSFVFEPKLVFELNLLGALLYYIENIHGHSKAKVKFPELFSNLIYTDMNVYVRRVEEEVLKFFRRKKYLKMGRRPSRKIVSKRDSHLDGKIHGAKTPLFYFIEIPNDEWASESEFITLDTALKKYARGCAC